MATAIVAGGCFWCTEAVFIRVEGVSSVTPGYTGGEVKNPSYREVCTGSTGHAEAVKIIYDDRKVSYRELLEIFFATHDATTLNRQGNDTGTQYRSAIFYVDEMQKTIAEAYIKELTAQKTMYAPIVTEVAPAVVFYEAEEYHKNYYDANSAQPYCHVVIFPKLRKLEKAYSHKLK